MMAAMKKTPVEFFAPIVGEVNVATVDGGDSSSAEPKRGTSFLI